jgi:type II secretory pathway pseudopilin PulG
MIEIVIVIAVVVIIGINVLTTVSTRFRRWLYQDVK